MAESRRRAGERRGYMAIEVRERGKAPRGMKAAYRAASKTAWQEVAQTFHDRFRDDRFTEGHAILAGYAARRGQLLPRNSRGFRNSYFGRKLNSQFGGGRGYAMPLVYTGETRRNVARQFNITATSNGSRIAYAGSRTLNRRNPNSRIRMDQEFRRILPIERQVLARVYDDSLDRQLSQS